MRRLREKYILHKWEQNHPRNLTQFKKHRTEKASWGCQLVNELNLLDICKLDRKTKEVMSFQTEERVRSESKARNYVIGISSYITFISVIKYTVSKGMVRN